jgi:hypothetical protein
MALNKDADITYEIIQRLHARVQAGAATFLLKVKSHRGEALNEMADAAAEHGRGRELTAWLANKDVPWKRNSRAGVSSFEWQEAKNGVRKFLHTRSHRPSLHPPLPLTFHMVL